MYVARSHRCGVGIVAAMDQSEQHTRMIDVGRGEQMASFGTAQARPEIHAGRAALSEMSVRGGPAGDLYAILDVRGGGAVECVERAMFECVDIDFELAECRRDRLILKHAIE